jgi:hypothetical protein
MGHESTTTGVRTRSQDYKMSSLFAGWTKMGVRDWAEGSWASKLGHGMGFEVLPFP